MSCVSRLIWRSSSYDPLLHWGASYISSIMRVPPTVQHAATRCNTIWRSSSYIICYILYIILYVIYYILYYMSYIIYYIIWRGASWNPLPHEGRHIRGCQYMCEWIIIRAASYMTLLIDSYTHVCHDFWAKIGAKIGRIADILHMTIIHEEPCMRIVIWIHRFIHTCVPWLLKKILAPKQAALLTSCFWFTRQWRVSEEWIFCYFLRAQELAPKQSIHTWGSWRVWKVTCFSCFREQELALKQAQRLTFCSLVSPRIMCPLLRCRVQHAATRCNTLQHTAAHCSTLQHNAEHCNTS